MKYSSIVRWQTLMLFFSFRLCDGWLVLSERRMNIRSPKGMSSAHYGAIYVQCWVFHNYVTLLNPIQPPLLN